MTTRRRKRSKTDEELNADVTPIFGEIERYVYSPRGSFLPPSPVIVTQLFSGGELSFLEFLFAEESRPFLDLVFGKDGTAGAVILRDFRAATRGLYFGHRRTKSKARPPKNPGRLDESNSKKRGRLTEFAWRAYRGDPERRGRLFWKRTAGLIWISYRYFIAMRVQAVWIKQREDKRIAEIPKRREKIAARVHAHRERKKRKNEPHRYGRVQAAKLPTQRANAAARARKCRANKASGEKPRADAHSEFSREGSD